ILESSADLSEKCWIEGSAGADDGPPSARLQHRLDVGGLAEAAADLDRNREGPDDLADRGGLGGPALERPVEIHDVQARGPVALPHHGHGPRIFGEDRSSLGPALSQAHATSAPHVHGRHDLEAHFTPSGSSGKRRNPALAIARVTASALSRTRRSFRAGGGPSAGSFPDETASRTASRAPRRPGRSRRRRTSPGRARYQQSRGSTSARSKNAPLPGSRRTGAGRPHGSPGSNPCAGP